MPKGSGRPGPIAVLRPRLEEAIDYLLVAMDVVPPIAVVNRAANQYPDDFSKCGLVLVRNGATMLARRCFHDRALDQDGLLKQLNMYPEYTPQKAYAVDAKGTGYRSASKLIMAADPDVWDQVTMVKVSNLLNCMREVEKLVGLRQIAGAPVLGSKAHAFEACFKALRGLSTVFGL